MGAIQQVAYYLTTLHVYGTKDYKGTYNGNFFKYGQEMLASQLKMIVIFIRFDCDVIQASYQYIKLLQEQQQQYMSAHMS